MHTLSIRKLDNSSYKRLRLRAAKHGVSMEEEARRILSRGVAAPERISEVFRKNFGARGGISLKLARKPHQPMDFSE